MFQKEDLEVINLKKEVKLERNKRMNPCNDLYCIADREHVMVLCISR